MILNRQKRFDEAIAQFEEMIRRNNSFGMVLLQKGEVDQTVTHFQKAIRFSPTDSMAYRNLGMAYQQQGKLNQAMVQFRKAIDVDASNALAHFALGTELQKQRNYTDAAAALGEAVRLDPTTPHHVFN